MAVFKHECCKLLQFQICTWWDYLALLHSTVLHPGKNKHIPLLHFWIHIPSTFPGAQAQVLSRIFTCYFLCWLKLWRLNCRTYCNVAMKWSVYATDSELCLWGGRTKYSVFIKDSGTLSLVFFWPLSQARFVLMRT